MEVVGKNVSLGEIVFCWLWDSGTCQFLQQSMGEALLVGYKTHDPHSARKGWNQSLITRHGYA